MARKGKNKKKKRLNRNYTKKEFTSVFCSTCLICNKPNPKFCYSFLYKAIPKFFIKKVFNNLVDVCLVYHNSGRAMRTMSIEQFQNVVCKTGICYGGDAVTGSICKSLKDCYIKFMLQIGMFSSATTHEEDISNLVDFKNYKYRKSHKKHHKSYNKKKNNTRYVCKSYATFFSSNNKIFQENVRKILYGDNNIQQNKDKELPDGNSGTANRYAKD